MVRLLAPLFGALLFLACVTGQSHREKEQTLDYFKKFDVDGDLHLDPAEFIKSGGGDVLQGSGESEAWFKRHDVDKDGLLSMGELASSLFGGVANDVIEDQEYLSSYGGMPDDLDEGQPTWDAEEMEDGVRYDLFGIVRDGTLEELRDVLERVSSADMQMNDGECTPLHMALDMWDGWNMHSHMQLKDQVSNFGEKVLILIEHGADLRHGCYGRFSLQMAVQTRNFKATTEILQLLKSAGHTGRVDAETIDWSGPRHDLQPGGGSALHGAAYSSAFLIGVSKILVGHAGAGQGVQEMFKRGMGHISQVPPSELATRHNSFAHWNLSVPARCMASHGKTFSPRCVREAALAFNARFASALLSAGASPTAVDLNGNTPLHISAIAGDPFTSQLLIDAGAPLDVANDEGITPLDAAVRGGDPEVVDMVLRAAERQGLGAAVAAVRRMEGERGAVERGERPAGAGRGGGGGGGADGTCAAGAGGSGGWRGGCYEDLEIGFCDIAEVVATAGGAFAKVEEALREGRPLLVRGAIGDHDWEGVMGNWTREGMEGAFGDHKFKVFRHRGGVKESLALTMESYLRWMASHNASGEKPPDWLVDFELGSGHPLVDSHNAIVKRFVGSLLYEGAHNRVNNYQFMVAPARAGAPPHFHYTSARLMVYGRARWFLWPPSRAFYTGLSVEEWFKTDYPSLSGEERPLECVQRAGDLMVVPPMWGHSVLYLEDTAGMATLFMA